MKNYNKNIRIFTILIGYIRMAMEFDSYKDVYNEYEQVLDKISNWSKNYYLNKSFNNITYEESLQLHNMIDDVREKKIFDKKIGNEKEISDEILIWYEILIRTINEKTYD